MDTPTNDAQRVEDELVDQVVDRLADRFPDAERDEVEQIVDEEHHRLDGNPIRDYVPVLVEHEARERLHEEGFESAPRTGRVDPAEGPATDRSRHDDGVRAGTDADGIQAPLGIVGDEGALD